MGEIRRVNRRTLIQMFSKGKGEISGSRADVQDGRGVKRLRESNGFPSASMVAGGQEMVHEVVAASDLSEHLTNARSRFVNRHSENSILSGPRQLYDTLGISGDLIPGNINSGVYPVRGHE